MIPPFTSLVFDLIFLNHGTTESNEQLLKRRYTDKVCVKGDSNLDHQRNSTTIVTSRCFHKINIFKGFSTPIEIKNILYYIILYYLLLLLLFLEEAFFIDNPNYSAHGFIPPPSVQIEVGVMTFETLTFNLLCLAFYH